MKIKHIVKPNQDICPKNYTDLAQNCTRSINLVTPLIKTRQGLEIKKTVSMKHDGNFEINIFEKFPEEKETLLMTYKIKDIQESLFALISDKITTKPKIDLKFKQNKRGFISLKVITIIYLNKTNRLISPTLKYYTLLSIKDQMVLLNIYIIIIKIAQ